MKAFIMVVGDDSKKWVKFLIGTRRIERVENFMHLGVLFDSRLNWKDMVLNRANRMEKSIATLFRFSKKLGSKPIQEMVKLYLAKATSMQFRVGQMLRYCNV